MPKILRLADVFASLAGPWTPVVVASLDGMDLKAARLEGEFVWHKHDDADELFLVMQGQLRIDLRDGALHLGPGELTVIPRGVEHRPVAEDGCDVLLLERSGTVNTGDAEDTRRVAAPQAFDAGD